MESQQDCFVSGTLATVLLVSRYAGLAPLTFVRKGSGWRVSLSSRFNIYGYCFITVFNVFLTAAVIEHVNVQENKSFRLRTNTRRVVWVADACLLMTITLVSVFGSRRRMKSLIACFNHLQKINLELNIYHWPNWMEKQKMFLFMVWGTVVVILTTVDHVLLTLDFVGKTDKDGKKSIWISVLYSFYYCCYWILQLQKIQFIMIAMHVAHTFKAINERMWSVLQDVLKSNKPALLPLRENRFCFGTKRRKYNKLSGTSNIVDSVATSVNKLNSNVSTKSQEEIIRSLSSSFVKACDVVREVDRSYGLILLFMLGSWLYHLVITPYYLINNILEKNKVPMEYNGAFTAVQLMWCVLHAASLILVIEPCHMTHLEMVKTEELIGHLMCSSNSPYNTLATELEVFYKLLVLNQASYSPLKVTKLRRSLVATMFGSITTYLVVMVQL